MRTTFSRSVYFIHFINHFYQWGGNEAFVETIRKRDNPIDAYINIEIVLANTSLFVPRMAVNRYLSTNLYEAIEYLK
jgi:hypothetical protein